MPFKPSHLEVFLLGWLPFIISFVLFFLLLIDWRRFFALLLAVLAFAGYFVVGISSLHSLFGAMMLVFSGWAAVVFLALALYGGTRFSPPLDTAFNPNPTLGRYIVRTLIQCPNCKAKYPIEADSCPYCTDSFPSVIPSTSEIPVNVDEFSIISIMEKIITIILLIGISGFVLLHTIGFIFIIYAASWAK